jgi:hypothetical protein
MSTLKPSVSPFSSCCSKSALMHSSPAAEACSVRKASCEVPPLHLLLVQDLGLACGENRVARLMQLRNLWAKQLRRYKSTTKRN